jgi:putative nucleotidyltransferase with HDIG domain
MTKAGDDMEKKVTAFLKGRGRGRRIEKTTKVFLLFFVSVFILALTQSQFSATDLKIGDRAPEDIRAPFAIEDRLAYEAQLEESLGSMEAVYRVSPTVQITAKAKVSGYLDLVRDIKLRNNLREVSKIDELETVSPLELSTDLHKLAIETTFSSLNTVEAISEDILTQMLAQGIREDELDYQLLEIDDVVASLNLEEGEQLLVSNILKGAIEPNEFVDTIATERQMEILRETISPVIIEKNEIIVHKGETIGSEQMRIMELAKLGTGETSSWTIYLGIVIQLMLPLLAMILYIKYFNPEILKGRLVYLMFTLFMISLILGGAMEALTPYLIPSAFNAIIATLLVGPGIAIISNMVLVYMLHFLWSIPGELAIIMIIGNSAGIILLLHRNQRHRVLLNGIYMGAISFLFYLGYYFLGDIGTRDLLFNGGALIIGGLVSGVVSLGTLPLWENVFKVLTPLKLMELTDPNQPLLRRLFAEAPGTYHHSLIVGNLSEAAAASIGANPLLAKAGAYYHDIGKLKRPSYFKENQFGIENPHDSMEPIQSSEVIISHWEDGIKLGRENKLPSEIMDIIDQHHGNTLISYFYHKAAEEGNTLPEGRFRYGGQKPKTKEATVVMLADSVEAAVRSLKDMNESAIEEMVGKIIKGKIEDGQLDQSPITTKDMNMVRKTFISVLKGIYHERIEYPEKS